MEADIGFGDDSAVGRLLVVGMRRSARICVFICLLFVGTARGQQMYSYSQYMFNNYLVNPAVVGTYNYYQIRVNSRVQWAGLTDAPIVNTVSVFGPHAKAPMGFGGMLYYDMTGPTSRAGLMGSYGYNLRLNDEMRISMGLSLGFMAYTVDASKFDLGDNPLSENRNDPALLSYVAKTSWLPDASVGVYLYATFFYVGLSAHQLFYLPMKFKELETGRNHLSPHVFLSGGYLLYFFDYLEFEPAALIKYSYPSPVQFELSVKMTYKNMVWGGLAYRFQDAVSLLVGYKHNNRILIGYSFDFSYTGLWRYSAGSHEIFFGYQFDKIK